MSPPRRNVLVFGSTGKQGNAFIASVQKSEVLKDVDLVALTRKALSPAAHALASNRVHVVEGDLELPETIRKVFQERDIWGVFIVLAFPGLGVDPSGQERQGMVVQPLHRLEYH